MSPNEQLAAWDRAVKAHRAFLTYLRKEVAKSWALSADAHLESLFSTYGIPDGFKSPAATGRGY